MSNCPGSGLSPILTNAGKIVHFFAVGVTCENQVLNFLIHSEGSNVATSAFYNKTNQVIGYLYSSPQCADCTIRGNTKKPAFWK